MVSRDVFASTGFPSCLSQIDTDQVDYRQQPVATSKKNSVAVFVDAHDDHSKRYGCRLHALNCTSYIQLLSILLATSMLERFMPPLSPEHACCHPSVASTIISLTFLS